MKELKNEIKQMKAGERKTINTVLFELGYSGTYNVYCGDITNIYEISDSCNWVYGYKLKELLNLLESKEV